MIDNHRLNDAKGTSKFLLLEFFFFKWNGQALSGGATANVAAMCLVIIKKQFLNLMNPAGGGGNLFAQGDRRGVW